MKKISLILVIATLLLSCNSSESQNFETASVISKKENDQLKRYNVESGIIIYQTTINGNVMGSVISGTGTEKTYFKDWGGIELIEEESTQTTTMKMFGQNNVETTNTHTIAKLDNGESYHVDFKKEEIYVRRDMAMDLTKMFQPNQDAGAVGKSMAEGMGGKIVGNESFLGYDCEIMELAGSKQWIYKGVTLKMEMTVMGVTTIKEATSAKFDINVADRYFELPDFPIIKEEGFMTNEEFDEDMEDYSDEVEELKNMSYEEWKKIVSENDEEMQNMSDKELRETYDMMQSMLRLQK